MITNDDLLKELSQTELIELSDLHGTFEINQDVIDDALGDAMAFIGSFFKIPANPTPLLKQITALLTIIELKRKQNFPKNSYEEELKHCEDMLLKMANKKIPTDISDQDKKDGGIITKQRAFVHGGKLGNWENLNG